jgi:hypothetical protein
MSRRRDREFAVLLWAIGLVIVLTAGEVIARYFIAGSIDFIVPSRDPELVYELRPGDYRVEGIFFRIPAYDVAIDSNGCRMQAFDKPATDSGNKSVLLIGDSFVFGDGVSGAETFPVLLESLLPGLRTINCGVPGYNLVQVVRAAELRAAQFQPALLVIVIYRNDLESALPLDRVLDAPDWVQWLRRYSRLFRLLYIARGWLAGDFGGLPPLPASAVEDALARTARLASTYRTVLIVLREPPHPQVHFAQELQRLGLRSYQTPLSFFDRSLQIPNNLHWTPEGHRRFAEWLAPLLQQELTLSKTPDSNLRR